MANNTRSKFTQNNDTTSDPLGVDICIGSPAPAPSSRRRQLSAPVKMPANTDSAFKIPASIDPALFEAIKLAVQVAMQEHNAKMLERMDKIVADVSNLNKKYDNIEKAIQDCSGRLDAVVNTFLPSLNKKVADLNTALAIQVLDMDQHRRKWSLIVQGLSGEAGESGAVTRKKCVDLAKKYLKVSDACAKDFSACHRLNSNADAAIIIKFIDLDQRNLWLTGARGLAAHPKNISICPDLPPIARDLKKDILQKRKELDSETKKLSQIKYLKSFPYVQLSIRGKDPIRPTIKQQDLVEKFLNTKMLMRFQLSD